MLRVTWHGHACFEVSGDQETVVTDPFSGVGLPEPKAQADVVLCSHSHGDHNNPGPLSGEGCVVLVGFVGSQKVGDVGIKGVSTYHDNEGGSKRGANSIYVFTMDGVIFCHLGDLGHVISESKAQEIGQIDVFFTPVGGLFTIDPEQATIVAGMLKPKIIVPMHYNMQGLSPIFAKLHSVEAFLKDKTNVRRLNKPTFTVYREDLPREPVIVVPSVG